MAENCPILTPAEKQVVDIIKRADDTLAAAVSQALQEVTRQAAEEMQAAGQEQSAPALQYFASVVHQRMYCLMCGADPNTFEGGNPDIAYHVIRNSQNIAKHYWAADIEPYPPK
ncbi:hypothetical protein MRBLMR1_002025 [Neorhizobium sp. LMR1-1-1.1]